MSESKYGDAFSQLGQAMNLESLASTSTLVKALSANAARGRYYNPLEEMTSAMSKSILDINKSVLKTGGIAEATMSAINDQQYRSISEMTVSLINPTFRGRDFTSAYQFLDSNNEANKRMWELAIPTMGSKSAWESLAERIAPSPGIDMSKILGSVDPSIFDVAAKCLRTAKTLGASTVRGYVDIIQASADVQELADELDQDPDLIRELEEVIRVANWRGFITSRTSQGLVIAVGMILKLIMSFCCPDASVVFDQVIDAASGRLTKLQREKHKSLIDDPNQDDELES